MNYNNLSTNIVLIGPPLAGKTSTAKLLASRFGVDSVDTDELIQDAANSVIEEIIVNRNEEYFRSIEEQIVSKVLVDIASNDSNSIISLGGGTILNSKVYEILHSKKFYKIYLQCSAQQLFKRYTSQPRSNHRFLIPHESSKVLEYFEKCLEHRDIVYSKLADLTINCDDYTQEYIVDKIYDNLRTI